ncbi:hypothetical protein C7E23_15190 [Elizabethkingia anophelis]|nr:hypothetical protein C7E23_15190 [Elizabethkingia anophelis]
MLSPSATLVIVDLFLAKFNETVQLNPSGFLKISPLKFASIPSLFALPELRKIEVLPVDEGNVTGRGSLFLFSL